MRKAFALLLFAGLVSVLPTAAHAARGGNGPTTGSTSTVTIDQPGPYQVGDRVTFTPSTTATAKPWEKVQCFQNGALVMNESHPDYWPNTLDDPGEFVLGPTDLWTSGGANCVATLQMNTKQGMKPLATVSFAVAG